MSGWTEVDCNVSELLAQSPKTTVYASFTDMEGEYGEPKIYTEWGLDGDVEMPVLRSWGKIGSQPCRHLVPARKETTA